MNGDSAIAPPTMKTKILPALALGFFLGAVLLTHAEIRVKDAPPPGDGDKPGGIAVPKPTTGAEGGDPANPATAGGIPNNDVLTFDNRDGLHGRLVAISAQTGIHWKHPDVKQPMEVTPSNVTSIKLDRRRPPAPPAAPGAMCVVRLTNNDELVGNLVSLDAEKLELDTWYAGRINIVRKMIKAITPTQNSSNCLYEGPTNLEGWVQGRGQNAWKFANNALVSTMRNTGTIGRDMKLPAMSIMDFDLAWRGQLNLMLFFHTDTFEAYTGNCNAYSLNINQGYLYLQRWKAGGGNAQLGNSNVQSMQTKNKAKFSIRCNKEKASITLMVDGVRVQEWKDPNGFASNGTGIMFYNQSGGLVSITNLRVAEWDGRFDDDSIVSSAKSKEDGVRLANGDKVSGKIQTIKDGKLAFATSYATLDIAMARVMQIEMADETAEQAKRNTGDIRAVFSDRGSVTFQLEAWDDSKVTGSSQNFGKIKINPNAFGMIHFNLDREKPATEENGLSPEDEMNE